MTERAELSAIDPMQPVGAIVAVTVGGEAMAAIRTADGWIVTTDRCPHAQCPFTTDGELADDGTLICNCHGSEFDPRTGELLLGPAQVGLVVTQLEVERNRLKFDPR